MTNATRISLALSAALLVAASSARAQMPAPASADPGRVWDAAQVSQAPMLINERHVARLVSRAYPPHLLAFGMHGRAVLILTIDPAGRVESAAQADYTHPAFGAAALGFARTMRFAPATVDGVPVRCRVAVPVDFALADG